MNPLTVTFFLELAISSVKLVNLGFYLHPSASYRFLIFIKDRNVMHTILPPTCHYNIILITELAEVILLNLEVNSSIHVQEYTLRS